jgi:hypothetical protein
MLGKTTHHSSNEIMMRHARKEQKHYSQVVNNTLIKLYFRVVQ